MLLSEEYRARRREYVSFPRAQISPEQDQSSDCPPQSTVCVVGVREGGRRSRESTVCVAESQGGRPEAKGVHSVCVCGGEESGREVGGQGSPQDGQRTVRSVHT